MAYAQDLETHPMNARVVLAPGLPEGQRDARLVVRCATEGEIECWDDLILRFDHRLYHLRAWIRSVQDFSTARPIYLVGEKNREIVFCLCGFLSKIGPIRIFGSPREGWQTESMGPVFDSDAVTTGEIFSRAIPFLEKEYGVHHIELASEYLDYDAMTALNFQGTRLFTYRAPLFPGDDERALAALDKKTRNQLRKAQKLGLTVSEERTEDFVDEFLDQANEVFTRRGKLVPFSRTRVLALFRRLHESGHLLALSVRKPEDGACIGTGLFAIEGRELTLWGWAHRTEARWYCPMEILTWAAMQKGMASGCTLFQMTGGGAGKPKFGATGYEGNYRWIRSRYRWIAAARQLAARAYRWQQAARGRRLRTKSQSNEPQTPEDTPA